MRLFTAITLDDEIKDYLMELSDTLRGNSIKGNFTRRDNLHLTLVFLGETDRVMDVRRVMDGIESPIFEIETGEIGCFRRPRGDIYWLGLKPSPYLWGIQNRLSSNLTEAGFSLDRRRYQPHLTLGREVILKKDFDIFGWGENQSSRKINVPKVSLMKSERIEGQLVYEEIYSVQLAEYK